MKEESPSSPNSQPIHYSQSLFHTGFIITRPSGIANFSGTIPPYSISHIQSFIHKYGIHDRTVAYHQKLT